MLRLKEYMCQTSLLEALNYGNNSEHTKGMNSKKQNVCSSMFQMSYEMKIKERQFRQHGLKY